MSVVTSLPDVSEISGATLGDWESWFSSAVHTILKWLPSEGVAVFYQSDVRHGPVWVDKAYLVQRGAEHTDACLLWHKIACRRPVGTPSLGRSTYSHILCFARTPWSRLPRHAMPDVLPEVGTMDWSRAMGASACEFVSRFLVAETNTTTVVDPFCGQGTMLAVANAFGLAAIGVDLSRRRCRLARNATWELGKGPRR